jgi:type II secretory ATPase GspE/PulE/Tfp pilus assembly ATPase PilB-like protein
MGRTGLYEFLPVNETIREMILDRAMAFDLRRYARREIGMLVLREEGIIRCVKGVTSAKEVMDHTDLYED